MAKLRLCVDIDNTIARTDEVMRRVIREYTGGRVNLRYEDVVEFHYPHCSDANGNSITDADWQQIHELFCEPRYLWAIQPSPGVQSRLRTLADQFELHLATSRLARARRTTIEWLENHSFPEHNLHFVRHKEKHLAIGGICAAVEDHYEQAIAFAMAGTPCYLIN